MLPRTFTLRARHVFAAPGRVHSPGIVEIRDGRVAAVGPCRGGARVDDVLLLPGLVNAHVHLALAALARPQREFLPWIDAVLAARQHDDGLARQQRIAAALAHLLAEGCTAVGEIDSDGDSPAVLAAAGFAGRCYRELTGFDLDAAAASTLVRARAASGTRRCAAGLSPHAPYSVSPALFRAAARHCRHLSVHVAETEDEIAFLRTGGGPFATLLRRMGRLPAAHRPAGCGAIGLLARLGLLRAQTQLVHAQHLQPGEAERIATAGATITVCPGTIDYFRRRAPDVPRWLELGIPVALGTDSPASAEPWSMRAALARAAQLWPGLAPTTLLAMATVHGARALSRPGLGRIRAGGVADLLAVPAAATADGALEAFVSGAAPVQTVWLHGRRHVAESVG